MGGGARARWLGKGSLADFTPSPLPEAKPWSLECPSLTWTGAMGPADVHRIAGIPDGVTSTESEANEKRTGGDGQWGEGASEDGGSRAVRWSGE